MVLPQLPRLSSDLLHLVGLRRHQVHAALAGHLLRQQLRVAAEDDVRAAARHVGGDGDCAVAASLGDDGRLTLMVLGVEDLRLLEGAHRVVGPTLLQLARGAALEQVCQPLRVLDGDGAHEHRPSLGMHLLDLLHCRQILAVLHPVDDVRVVIADHRAVGGND